MSVLLALQGAGGSYTLAHTAANITFGASADTFRAGRVLAETKANLAFGASTDTFRAGRVLAHTKANITFTGGSHALVVGRVLSHAKANIAFGASTESFALGKGLQHVAANVAFTSGDHVLVGPSVEPTAIGVLYPPTPPFLPIDYKLAHRTPNIRFLGGRHGFEIDTTIREEEEALLVLV